MSAESLPRLVKTSEHWPPKLIVKIGPTEPCQHCGQQIAYFHDRDLTGEWVHLDTEQRRCVGTKGFSLAAPIPRCPQCRSSRVKHTAEAWGNSTDCPDCNYHGFASIGE